MSKQVHFAPTSLSLICGIKKNAEFKIPSLRYIGLFSQSVVFKTEGLQNVVVSI